MLIQTQNRPKITPLMDKHTLTRRLSISIVDDHRVRGNPAKFGRSEIQIHLGVTPRQHYFLTTSAHHQRTSQLANGCQRKHDEELRAILQWRANSEAAPIRS